MTPQQTSSNKVAGVANNSLKMSGMMLLDAHDSRQGDSLYGFAPHQ